MRLIELEIHNVRGIPHLLLKPEGKNFVVWGPNGSGKSAVVDAVDFVLTGRVSRLTGKGTGDITLSRHGPHIDHTPSEARVRAIVKLSGESEPIEISRCMDDASTLECDESKVAQLEPIMTLAGRGQHVLTRREILKYITAEPSTRAEEIQELLNVTEIEDTRKTLVKVLHSLERELQTAKHTADTARGAVNATIQSQTYREDIVRRAVNQNRRVLGGEDISSVQHQELKSNLRPPVIISESQTPNFTVVERDIQNLIDVTSDQKQSEIAQSDDQLRALIKKIRADPRVLRALSHLKLIELGITLIDESGSCPLCGASWPPGKLHEHLEQRLSTAQAAARSQKEITELSDVVAGSVSITTASLKQVINTMQAATLEEGLRLLQSWLRDLEILASILITPLEMYPDPRFPSDKVQRMLSPPNAKATLEHVREAIKTKYPQATPEQTAWDTLTRLEENLKSLESAEKNSQDAELFQQRASILLQSFQAARDSVLGKLYESISDRFVSLYRQLHGSDESGFDAKLEPDGAALNFEVDFYGRGTHPPHALHSEGHQDSMGLCLYLALAERLTGGLIDLTILDDVVMSVDVDHRRQVCTLLSSCFPDRQFLITTHDKTWANQLRTEGVVSSKGLVEFYNWSIESGPQVNYEVDIWDRIELDLKNNNIPDAAAKLRRGSEQFFSTACDALEASVIYKLDGRLELGNLLPAAIKQYRALLKQAKKAAQTWGDKDTFERLQEIDSIVGPIYTRSQAEQWAINANVHYNNWASFSENDFRPVVEAFQDLFGLFVCSGCGGILRVANTGMARVSVRCSCGKVVWNLTERDNPN